MTENYKCHKCNRQNVRINFTRKLWICNNCETTWAYIPTAYTDKPLNKPLKSKPRPITGGSRARLVYPKQTTQKDLDL